MIHVSGSQVVPLLPYGIIASATIKAFRHSSLCHYGFTTEDRERKKNQTANDMLHSLSFVTLALYAYVKNIKLQGAQIFFSSDNDKATQSVWRLKQEILQGKDTSHRFNKS